MIFIEQNTKSVYSESIKKLRVNVKYSSIDNKNKIILITSTEKGEGKSTIATNLSVDLSKNNEKTLIIDCDLRRPTIHKHFNISGSEGLTDCLAYNKNVESVIRKYNENLDILPAGNIPPNPVELVSSLKLEKMLKELKEKYDYIIIDTTPLEIVADAQILSSKVDGTIIVTRQGKTNKYRLLECKKCVEQVGGKIIGITINRYKMSEKIYSYSW